jgi:hypothetical protein
MPSARQLELDSGPFVRVQIVAEMLEVRARQSGSGVRVCGRRRVWRFIGILTRPVAPESEQARKGNKRDHIGQSHLPSIRGSHFDFR